MTSLPVFKNTPEKQAEVHSKSRKSPEFCGTKKEVISVLKLSGGLEGLNPLAHLNDPLPLVNFNPLGGRCNLPSSYHFTVNEWFRVLLITTRPPSTTMHCISCVRSFGHHLVIKINFSAKQSTKRTFFPNLKFWRRGHCPLPQRDRGGSPLNPIQHACLDSTFWPTALDPLAVFGQFEHWVIPSVVLCLVSCLALLLECCTVTATDRTVSFVQTQFMLAEVFI